MSYPLRAAGGPSRGNCEVKRGALAHIRFDPDAAPVTLHNLAANGHPNTISGVLIARVQALEQFENTLGIRWIDSDSVIAHRHHQFVRLPFRPYVDARDFVCAVFDR